MPRPARRSRPWRQRRGPGASDAHRCALGSTLGRQPENPVVQKVLEYRLRQDRLPAPTCSRWTSTSRRTSALTPSKQAETFAAVREAYGIERQENVQLRDFPTLQHVVQFVYDFRPDLAPEAPSPAHRFRCNATPGGTRPRPRRPPPPRRHPHHPSPPLRRHVHPRDADTIPRRVPVPSLRPDLELCKPTGVHLGRGTRVLLVNDDGGVGQALGATLGRKGVRTLKLDPATPTDELRAQLGAWLEEGPIQGVFWLPALDVEPGASRTWTWPPSGRPAAVG